MADARRNRFDIVLVAAFDRVARSVRHFLELLDELNHLGIEFISHRENIDTSGPLGHAMVIIVGAIAEPRIIPTSASCPRSANCRVGRKLAVWTPTFWRWRQALKSSTGCFPISSSRALAKG